MEIKSKETITIDLTPEYATLFVRAIAIVDMYLEEDQSKDFVITLLEYGKRLHNTKDICPDPLHINPDMPRVWNDPYLT